MNRFYHFLTILILFTSLNAQSQARTVGLVKYNANNKDGYCLFSPLGTKKTFLIDKCGRKVHEWTSTYNPGLAVLLLPDGSLLRAGSTSNSYFGAGVGGILEKFDWEGNRKWYFALSDTNQVFHHDFKLLPNGHILAIVWENHSAADAIANGRNPAITKKSIWSERIEELDPYEADSAIVVWKWSVWDHLIQDFDSTLPNYDVVKNHPELFDINFTNGNKTNSGQDWLHFNGIDYNAEMDQILISGHTLDEIYIIDHSTNTTQAANHVGGRSNMGGDLLYRWGNAASYRRGGTSDIRLFHAHHATWIPKGHTNAGKILIFNNGLGRPGTSKYSSIDLVTPPVNLAGNYSIISGKAYGPDTQLIVYKAAKPTDFYSQFMGGVYPLENARYLITDAINGTIFEVKGDTIVWKYVNPFNGGGSTKQGSTPTTNYVFRSEFYAPNFAAFSGRDMTPGEEIELEPDSVKLCTKPIPPLYAIQKINHQNTSTGVADSLGVVCRIKGTVQTINYGAAGIHLVVADNSGGIRVFDAKNAFGKTLSMGDSILVQGTIEQALGWCTIGKLDTIVKLGQNKPLKSVLQTNTIIEKNESGLVQLHRVKFTDPVNWPINAMAANALRRMAIEFTDGRKDSVYIYGTTDIDGQPQQTKYLDITGVVGQFDGTKPYMSNYTIIPRGIFDFAASSLPKINFAKKLDSIFQPASSFDVRFVNATPEENFTFSLVVKGGTAVPQQDFFYTEKVISVLKTVVNMSESISLKSNPDFIGTRYIDFAIRKVNGPGTIGADSVFRMQIPGKIVNSNNLVRTEVAKWISLYPNPNQNVIYINTADPMVSVAILNASGQTVLNQAVSGVSIKLPHNLANGIYFVKTQNIEGEFAIKQLVVCN